MSGTVRIEWLVKSNVSTAGEGGVRPRQECPLIWGVFNASYSVSECPVRAGARSTDSSSFRMFFMNGIVLLCKAVFLRLGCFSVVQK